MDNDEVVRPLAPLEPVHAQAARPLAVHGREATPEAQGNNQ